MGVYKRWIFSALVLCLVFQARTKTEAQDSPEQATFYFNNLIQFKPGQKPADPSRYLADILKKSRKKDNGTFAVPYALLKRDILLEKGQRIVICKGSGSRWLDFGSATVNDFYGVGNVGIFFDVEPEDPGFVKGEDSSGFLYVAFPPGEGFQVKYVPQNTLSLKSIQDMVQKAVQKEDRKGATRNYAETFPSLGVTKAISVLNTSLRILSLKGETCDDFCVLDLGHDVIVEDGLAFDKIFTIGKSIYIALTGCAGNDESFHRVLLEYDGKQLRKIANVSYGGGEE